LLSSGTVLDVIKKFTLICQMLLQVLILLENAFDDRPNNVQGTPNPIGVMFRANDPHKRFTRVLKIVNAYALPCWLRAIAGGHD
jgi:hypothetical protein